MKLLKNMGEIKSMKSKDFVLFWTPFGRPKWYNKKIDYQNHLNNNSNTSKTKTTQQWAFVFYSTMLLTIIFNKFIFQNY